MGSRDEKVRPYVNSIASPLAEVALCEKLFKAVKKATKDKLLRRGVKEVVKALRKGVASKGLCVIAGDISPIDVITHVPILCEDHDVPYVFVPSKHDLGEAATTKRPTSCVMIIPGDDWKYAEKFAKLRKKVAALSSK